MLKGDSLFILYGKYVKNNSCVMYSRKKIYYIIEIYFLYELLQLY